MVENCVGGYNSCMFAYGQVSPSANFHQKCVVANCFDYSTLILFHTIRSNLILYELLFLYLLHDQ